MTFIRYRNKFNFLQQLLTLLVLTLMSLSAAALEAQSDEQQIDALVSKLYASISFTDGKGANEDALNEIYHENALVGSISKRHAQVFTSLDFRARNAESIAKNQIVSFVEKELKHKTMIYGGVATRFSHYEFDIKSKTNQLNVKGVNVIQLIKDPKKGWQILSVVFSDNRSFPDPV